MRIMMYRSVDSANQIGSLINKSGKTRPTIAVVMGSSGRSYKIKKHEKYGLSCECPAWINNIRGDRTCKHTELVERQEAEICI